MLSSLRRLFAPRSAPRLTLHDIGRPQPLDRGQAQRVRSLGNNVTPENLWGRLAGQPEAHVDAVLSAYSRGQRVLAKHPELAAAPARQVHLVHVQFAPGTARAVGQGLLPVGVKGTQLGAAYCVRGHKGHLHAYALVLLHTPRKAK